MAPPLDATVKKWHHGEKTALMKACHEGAVSQVKELVAEGTKKPGWINSHNDVNDKKQEGKRETALHFGCLSGNAEICSILIDNGASIEASDSKGRRPLHWACEHDKLEVVKLLLQRGAELEAAKEEKYFIWVCTVFHCVCQGGLFEVAKAFLREHGSQILEQRDEFGMTPYLSCVTSGSWELIEWMQSNGCNIAVRNGWGETALHLCLMCRDESTFFRLFEKCADQISKTISKDQVSCAEKCLEIRNDNGETLFLLACKKGLLKAVNFLLELNCRWQLGASGLHLSCEMGHVSIVEVLLNKCEFDLDETDEMDETALMKAARSGNVIIVDMLMKMKQWDLGHRNTADKSVLP
ncbi:ankyrin homolog [Oscarella lobularis]|uniref:ankyrin homolog n=1 Tax=Oscarella lobularis TaxID=121494 RepID=UPI00331322E6